MTPRRLCADRSRWTLAGSFLGAAVLTAAGCAPVTDGAAGPVASLGADGDTDRVGTLRSAVRPTDADGTCWYNNCYDVPPGEVRVFDPPGNHFRVYYTVTGTNAVDTTDDAPKDGVPDFVAQVGTSAETTYQSTIVTRGFRAPLDDSKWNDGRGFGGDGRFDIYLRWAGTGSDGYRVTEACTDGEPGETPGRCAGYFVMNPSYKTSHYGSELDGIQVLTSHELFHSIQDAYSAAQWRTWAEGTAVWNELQVFPTAQGTQRDYLGFIRTFFNQPERPFDKSTGSGPGTTYAYASAAWVQYLSERFGPLLVRQIWERLEADTPADAEPKYFLDVTEALLRDKHQTDLATAWSEFNGWRLLTGPRADAARGFGQGGGMGPPAIPAAMYPSVRLEPAVTALGTPVTFEVDGMSARYLVFSPVLSETSKLRLQVKDPGPVPVGVVAYRAASGAPLGAALAATGGVLDVDLSPGETLYVVLSGARAGRARDVVTELAPAPPPSPDAMMPGADLGSDTEPMPEGGCTVAPFGVPVSAPALPALTAAALGLLGLARRRRPMRA